LAFFLAGFFVARFAAPDPSGMSVSFGYSVSGGQ